MEGNEGTMDKRWRDLGASLEEKWIWLEGKKGRRRELEGKYKKFRIN